MTQLDVTPPGAADVSASTLTTAASHEAYLNRQANVQALSLSQPLIAHPKPLPRDVEWVYARDGALTARLGGEWWSECSVPRESARVLLRNLQVSGTACYLRPGHAAELVVALQMLAANQALVAVVPDVKWFHLALHGHDFSADIRGNRLWFAVGANWAGALRKIFDDHPALPIPTQLIRTPLLEQQEVEGMVSVVQRAFDEITPRRDALLTTFQERPRRYTSSSVKRLCVVAPSLFRLWDDAGATLANVLRQPRASTDPVDCRTHDPDDPCSSGPLAITLAARFCDALVVADRTRAQLGRFVPPMVSVITWVTTAGVVPRFDGSAARDALMMADPQWVPLARGAGWPEHRVAVAQWPAAQDEGRAAPKCLAIIADTIDASAALPPLELSSHRLLWELIHGELLEDPFALGGDVPAYLNERMKRQAVGEQNFDRRRFVEQLIVPTYQQGLARLLLREKLPVRLHGRGWEKLGECASRAPGPVASRGHLLELARDAVVVHAWPSTPVHPAESLGRPILRRAMNVRAYVSNARRLLSGGTPPPAARQPLSAETILSLI